MTFANNLHEENVTETVKHEVSNAKSVIVKSVKRKMAETVNSMVGQKMKELQDRNSRITNLILLKVKKVIPQSRNSVRDTTQVWFKNCSMP